MQVRVLRWVVFGLAAMMGCAGAGTQQRESEDPPAPPSLLLREVPKKKQALSFPPPMKDRRARPALEGAPGENDELAVRYPELDAGRKFVVHGKTVSFVFTEPMRGAAAGAPAGKHVALDPPVVGLATWRDGSTLEFEAAKHLDPKSTFKVTLRDLEAVSGKKLDKPWEATFRSTVGAVVAGKNLGHVPVPGEHRVVVVLPGNDSTISTRPRFRVLYDQSIHLAQARQLVKLIDKDDKEVPLSIAHAPVDAFEGNRVDRRFVVIASPMTALAAGGKYKLVADDAGPSPLRHQAELHIAQPLRFTEATCGWWTTDDQTCKRDQEKRHVLTDRREIHLLFNNDLHIRSRRVEAHVSVTPPVRNLSVHDVGYGEGRLQLSGDFRASTRYRVRVQGLEDVFGQRQREPVAVELEVMPLGASVSMPEGLVMLDDKNTRAFAIVSRNVERAEMRLWKVKDGDVKAFRQALSEADKGGKLRDDKPHGTVDIKIVAKRDELVTSEIDLRGGLTAGASYLATIVPTRFAFGAAAAVVPENTPAARPPVALLRPAHGQSLRVHAHSAPGSTIVQVARLANGEPVAGARVSSANANAKTDARGVAVLAQDTSFTHDAFVTVEAAGDTVLLPLANTHSKAHDMFPDLAQGTQAPGGRRAFVVTDRGIYRPGSVIEMKGSLFERDGAKLTPVRKEGFTLRVLGPTSNEICKKAVKTNDMGSAVSRCKLPPTAKLGLHRVELADGGDTLATELVRVAAFEAPRFKVDVETALASKQLASTVRAQYLFGSPMSGATVDWTVKREAAPFPTGALTEAGLAFGPEEYGWDEEEKPKEDWSLSGTSLLDEKGALDLRQAVVVGDAARPQRFTIEADVTDSSHRHVAGRASAIAHSRSRYAGLRLSGGWVAVGKPLRVELGVMDREGKSVSGATATARLTRVEWRQQRVRVAGGAVRSEWRKTESEVTRCSVKSETRPVACELTVPRSGDYQVVAEVDGHAGGSRAVWAWRDGDTGETARGPSRGSAIPIVADKASYAPGETARILVRNPYPAAIAVLTLEQGELVSHESKRVDKSAAVFDVPVRAEHAPHIHAAVTLLPIGAQGEQAVSYRVGALRVPVATRNSRLTVTTKSVEGSYRPGAEAEIQLEVSDGNKPEAHAEVALAVVDEGVLRLTGFRAEDPTDALRPAQALSFLVRSTHASLADLMERSHVAGDGGGDELGSLTDARRRFVETALWKPQVRTDGNGRARLRFRLPDNLTEFRIMAVAVDDEGKGGAAEASFTVNKPLMIEPIVPRFAHRGDAFEAAAMVHNQSGKPFKGAVRIRGERIPIELAADTRQRVGMSMRFERPGETKLAFAMEDEKGKVVDAAERKLRVELPGVEAHPQISDAFAGTQAIALAIPEDAIFEPGAKLTVQAGEHLWPELGARLEYLLDYPYGCVEQTTSSTLPLIAARDILPRIGVHQYGDEFFRERINFGLERLNKMRTSSGGLAYWPGGDEPNVYGTAYAIRAVLRAKQAGIEPPEGLLEGMKKYLRAHIGSVERYLRPSIAQSLAEAGDLPAGMLDSLYADRTEQDLFGKASVVIALSLVKGQDDRVKTLLDEIEKHFDERGRLKASNAQDRFGYFESEDRTIAQVAMALSRLRKSSRLLPLLIQDLAGEHAHYTTHGSAFGLLAIADHLSNAPERGAAVVASLDGRALAGKDLGAGGVEITIPLAELTGKKRKLELSGPAGVAVGFRVSAHYRIPLSSQGGEGASGESSGETWQSAAKGPDVYRVFTTPEGVPIDMAKVKAGGLVRVTLVVRVPGTDKTYLAVTDRIAAGFEPVDPDLATVASAPEIGDAHPFAEMMRYSAERANHVELHDDRVHIHFDRLYGELAIATYLMRATTPGTFVLPPATGELMYVPGSLSYSEAGRVTIL